MPLKTDKIRDFLFGHAIEDRKKKNNITSVKGHFKI